MTSTIQLLLFHIDLLCYLFSPIPPYACFLYTFTHTKLSTRSSTMCATFDTMYDNRCGSLNSLAYSNVFRENGLAARFPTFGNIPTFLFIGGAPDVAFNSPKCGGCWKLISKMTGASLIMSTIDNGGSGFNLAREAFVTSNSNQIGQVMLDVIVFLLRSRYYITVLTELI